MYKALLFAGSLVTCFAAQASDQQEQEFRGNWTKSFALVDGSQVVHTPQNVRLGGMQCRDLNMSMKQYNGYPVNAPLQLKTDSTEEEFLQALSATGLLKETK